jgi:methylmalonyl-CoA mutase C-terminal domain/subunit
MSAAAPLARIRVLIAKPGLDGHDVGAKIVCRGLMEAGMEVIYTGLRQSPQAIATAAMQEAVDVVGLSILSGAHLPLCIKLAGELRKQGIDDVPWIVGGNVPLRDAAALREAGAAAVFPTGSRIDDIVRWIHEQVATAKPVPGRARSGE